MFGNEVSLRYEMDEVEDFDYAVFDRQLQGQPVVYRLFAIPIQNGWNNYQLTLTVFDASVTPEEELVQFERELWSSQMYLDEQGLLSICERILAYLQSCEIESPVELAYVFGGTVNNVTPMYPAPSSDTASFIC